MQRFIIIVLSIIVYSFQLLHVAKALNLKSFDVTGQNLNFIPDDVYVIRGLPVVADLNNDGVQEIIINDATRLWVYELNEGNYQVRNGFPVTIPHENLLFRSIAAVGRFEGLDNLGIVIYGTRFFDGIDGQWLYTRNVGRIYLYNMNVRVAWIAQLSKFHNTFVISILN